MRNSNFSIVFVSVITLMIVGSSQAHHNGTCEEEETQFRTCMRRFFESRRNGASTTASPSSIGDNSTGPQQEEAERCFVSNGCQKPLFQGQQFEADLERVKVCKQQLRQKTQAAIKECAEKKSPDHFIPPPTNDDDRWGHKEEHEKRQHCQRWALAKQTQDPTICPVASNGEKVRTCLRDQWKRSSDDVERWHKELCTVKKDCGKDIPVICQEHMNITRTLKCDCGRERSPALAKEFFDCVGVIPGKDDQDHFADHHCKNPCANE